jgi:hypothetical protein
MSAVGAQHLLGDAFPAGEQGGGDKDRQESKYLQRYCAFLQTIV